MAAPRTSWAGKRLVRDQAGFTMIELVVGIFVTVAVIGALAALLISNNNGALASQRLLSSFSVLQKQIEQIHQTEKQYGFTAVALASAPTATCSPSTVNPTSPSAFVCGTGCSQTFTVEANYNSTTDSFLHSQSIADSPESLLVNGCTVSGNAVSGGQLSPLQYVDLQTGVASSSPPPTDPYATVYTYVTQTTTAGCGSPTGQGTGSGNSSGSCLGDVRRVVVAAVMNSTRSDLGSTHPTYSTTIITNPIASNQANTASGLRILGLIS